jgi:predicted GTPase
VRTGCGKSQTTKKICEILKDRGKRVIVVRHPMPYGNIAKQTAQRFCTLEDLDKHQCTIEEREEYEPLIKQGVVVYAGVDYGIILKRAEAESDIIIWDGGNNDTPFYYPQLHIVLFDPHRAGHELLYYPSESNMRMADVAIINKVDTAPQTGIDEIKANIKRYAPMADVLMAESPIFVNNPEEIKGKRVLVMEDGPTVTHGGMQYGAGVLAAQKFGAAELVDPRACASGSIKQVYETYPHIENLLPTMGYNQEQIQSLEKTIKSSSCELVLYATPIDLKKLLNIKKPMIRVRYEYKDASSPTLRDILVKRLGV